MKTYKIILVLTNLLLLLGYINYSIVSKERILNEGQLVLLELAPKDPRSLMQGDYMALRYKIADSVPIDRIGRRGYCVVKLTDKNVAQLIRFQKELLPLEKDELLLRYTSPDKWRIEIGAESYFFQEGQAKKYEQARYGGLKIDKNGNSLLIGLYDSRLKKIE